MGKSGYTSLSLNEKEYANLRRSWDKIVQTDQTFTTWATDVLFNGVARVEKLNKLFPGFEYVGKIKSGVIIKDKNDLIEVRGLKCNKDKGLCDHVLFACIHPNFEP